MKRSLLVAFFLVIIMTCKAQNFEYLTFEQADGTSVSLPVSGLVLTFSGNNLVSNDGTTIPLSSLSKMFFTETSGITPIPTILEEGTVSAYTPAGSQVGQFGDAQEAIRRLPKGLYILKDLSGKVVKTLVR